MTAEPTPAAPVAAEDHYRAFLDLVPDEGLGAPAAQFLLAVLIETDGGPGDAELYAAAQRCTAERTRGRRRG